MKTVSLKEDHTGLRLLCPVRLNNRDQRWFLLDTGAASTCVSARIAETVALLPLPELTRVFFLGQGVVAAQRGLATEFEIVGTSVRFFKQPIWIVADSVLEKVDGVLGMDLMQRLGQFSLRWRQLTIGDNLTGKRRFLPVPTTQRNKRFYLPLRLGDGEPIPFVWDTGSDTPAIISPNVLPAQLYRRGGTREKIPKVDIRVSVSENHQSRDETVSPHCWWRFPSARIAGLSLDPLPVYEYQKSPRMWVGGNYGLLGCPLLIEHEVFHDFHQKKLYFRRYRWDVAGTYGLMLEIEESYDRLRWYASVVIPTNVSGYFPEQSRFELLKVDGVPVEQWETIPLIRRLLFPTARTSCTVHYLDKGRSSVVVLHAIPVPYIGLPPQLLSVVQVPKSSLEWGLTPEKRVLSVEIGRSLRGVRGNRRRLRVRYSAHAWQFF